MNATITATEGGIHTAMVKIMSEVNAIGKDRKNSAQGYNFRGIDDVYFALHKVMAANGVFTTTEVLDERSEERVGKGGGALIYRILRVKITFWASDGSSVFSVVVGEGMDSGDKASNKALSVAQKYALLQAFLIPTEDPKDPEVDSPELDSLAGDLNRIRTAADLEFLRGLYTSLLAKYRQNAGAVKALAEAKDDRKAELTEATK